MQGTELLFASLKNLLKSPRTATTYTGFFGFKA